MNDHEQNTKTDSTINDLKAVSSTEINISAQIDDIGKEQIESIHSLKENGSHKPIEEDDDEFIRITAAHKMLIEAQTYEQQKNYPLALRLYRLCVDFLLEELMFSEGTDGSRYYLREKCTSIMDRIDILKTKLDPIPLSATDQDLIDNLPIHQIESLHLS